MVESPATSATPLYRKLGIKAGHRVAVLHAPDGFEALGQLPEGVEVRHSLAGAGTGKAEAGEPFDVVVWFGTSRDGLREFIETSRGAFSNGALEQAAGLWIGWPKRNSGIYTSVDADVVREIALPTGLVDNKICAIDASWSGIRLVLRRELRNDGIARTA